MVRLAGAGPAAEVEQHRRAVRANPKNAQAHALLGLALQKAGRLEEAIASQRRALQLSPSIKGLHGVMASALQQLGQDEAAVGSYRRALAEDGHDPELHRGLSEALRSLGQSDDALASAQQAAALSPDSADTYLTLAAALHAKQDFKGAADAFSRVLELTPDNLDARADHGHCLLRAGEYEAAAEAFAGVIERDPANVRAHIGRGSALRDQKKYEEAEKTLLHALELAPGRAGALFELGLTYQKWSKLGQAHECYLRAHEADPDDITVLKGVTQTSFNLGLWEDAVNFANKALATRFASPDMHSTLLFILSHCCDSDEVLTAEHFRYGELWETPLMANRAPHANERDPGKVLQVGFVSADLYQHAVSTFVEPVFERLKHSTEMELHVYYNNDIEDAATAKLRTHIKNWHSIAGVNDVEAEKMIREHRIDVLIDLSGHSAQNRLPLFARKPAPIQMTWIGYAGTTGLKAMDYYISDPFHLPPGRYDHQFTEKIARLPLGTPWMPKKGAPDVNPLPALTNGYITFGSFHRASKLSRDVVGLWGHLLRAVPDAKMLVGGLTQGSDDTLLGWFDEEGIDRDRLLLRYRAGMNEYLKQHYDVDVALASFPYTGATTACHALWMGVPTLTVTGETNPTYSTASYLAHLGLSSFIANDAPSFVALGQFLSQNLPTLAALRETMRERFTNSLVGYPGVSAAGLERAMRLMWHRWCQGLPAEDLQVRLSDLVDESEQEAAQ
jgi:predicted O-linked N-acetylglucosamine transferase (SPINDLY family)